MAAVQGAHNLTLDVTGAASIGPVTGLGSGSGAAITIDSAGATTFTGAVGTATGIVQTSNSAVTFADDVTIGSGGLDSLFNGSVTFNGAQFLSGGAVTFGDTSADALVIGNPGGAVVTTATAGRAVAILAATTLNGALAIDLLVFENADRQHLAWIVPLIDGVANVQPLVALKPNELGVENGGEGLGDFGLSDTGFAFEQQRFGQPEGEVNRGCQALLRNVALRLQRLLNGFNRIQFQVVLPLNRGTAVPIR